MIVATSSEIVEVEIESWGQQGSRSDSECEHLASQ